LYKDFKTLTQMALVTLPLFAQRHVPKHFQHLVSLPKSPLLHVLSISSTLGLLVGLSVFRWSILIAVMVAGTFSPAPLFLAFTQVLLTGASLAETFALFNVVVVGLGLAHGYATRTAKAFAGFAPSPLGFHAVTASVSS
jgi:hypothetical protein